MLGNYLQQTTSTDGNCRCVFFLTLKVLTYFWGIQKNCLIETYVKYQFHRPFLIPYLPNFLANCRVGSHMVVFGYTLWKNVRLLFHNDVKWKQVEITPCHLYPESFTPFSSPHFFPDLTMPGYPHKALILSKDCHKNFSGEDRTWIIEINCMDDNYFLCDRVCTQSKMLKEDILVAFEQKKCGLENGV